MRKSDNEITDGGMSGGNAGRRKCDLELDPAIVELLIADAGRNQEPKSYILNRILENYYEKKGLI